MNAENLTTEHQSVLLGIDEYMQLFSAKLHELEVKSEAWQRAHDNYILAVLCKIKSEQSETARLGDRDVIRTFTEAYASGLGLTESPAMNGAQFRYVLRRIGAKYQEVTPQDSLSDILRIAHETA